MPELPEVETVRRGLAPVMVGHTFRRVEQRRADLRFPLPQAFAKRLEGARVDALKRRAKYLLAYLSSGDVLLMHLGMSGRFTVAKERLAKTGSRAGSLVAGGAFTYATGAPSRHDHIVFHMETGTDITYNDPRRFGYMLLVPEAELDAHPLMRSLGVEPLGSGLTAEYLAERAAGRKLDLKAFLSDQRIIAGLGNIYVCEALFRARLKPTRRAATLATRAGTPSDRSAALAEAIRSVLADAIAAGGSSLRDYRRADGERGAFQERFEVYGREDERCLRPGCRGRVKRIVQAGRSTFFCPQCQR